MPSHASFGTIWMTISPLIVITTGYREGVYLQNVPTLNENLNLSIPAIKIPTPHNYNIANSTYAK